MVIADQGGIASHTIDLYGFFIYLAAPFFEN